MFVFFQRTEGARWEQLRCYLSTRTRFDLYEACYKGRDLMLQQMWEVRIYEHPTVEGEPVARFYRNENGAVIREGGVSI